MAIKELIRQIQVQQAENLLLTEQAISFQTVLMDAVKENIKTPANTYSKYQEKQAVSTAIIDQKCKEYFYDRTIWFIRHRNGA